MPPVFRLVLATILLAPALAACIERPTANPPAPDTTHQETISPLVLTLLLPFLALPAAMAHAEVAYLISESFDLPPTGVAVASMKALDPSARYRILISSPSTMDNLAPLELMRYSIKDGVGMFATDFRDPNIELWSGIGINGKLARTKNYAETEYSDTKRIYQLTFELQGTGRPLILRTVKNFSAALPTLRVDVSRLKPKPPPRPSMPQQANNRTSRSLPLPLVLGSIILTALIWRVIVYMRRRQLHIALRRLMADIQRVEKVRKTVHHHLDN